MKKLQEIDKVAFCLAEYKTTKRMSAPIIGGLQKDIVDKINELVEEINILRNVNLKKR